MEKRNYTKFKDIYTQLETYCAESLRNGNSILPSERDLVREFKVSRLTLRKAIEEAQMNGIIQREGRRTGILPDRRLANCGRILFITTGLHDVFLQAAFERIWLNLMPRVEALGGKMHLYFDHQVNGNFLSFRQSVQKSDVIFVTQLSDKEETAKLKLLQGLEPEKKIIALSDPYLDCFDNYAALDNRAVGKLAGQLMNRAGCRRVILLGMLHDNTIFDKRLLGFCSEFKGEIRNFPRIQGHNYFVRDAEGLWQAWNDGFDGAFIATDEHTPMLVSPLAAINAIPGKFKVITFNGTGAGMHCDPPLTCISHGTGKVVSILLDFLKKISRNGPGVKMKKLIKPDIYFNKSLGENEPCEL